MPSKHARWFVAIGIVLAFVGMACAAEEAKPEASEQTLPAVVAPSTAPAPGMAALVEQAVAKAVPGALARALPLPAPAAPSAAEIRNLVQQAVAAAVPAATDPVEVRRMVEAAVATGPGLTRAELEATIKAQAPEQMTAGDVKRVVDSAIAALPAPVLDTSHIGPLVREAVATSVPKGTSAAQIQAMVEGAVSAAVAAATARVPTRGQLQADIARSTREASEGQLTAEQVQAIVDTSLDSLAMSVQQELDSQADAAALRQLETAIRLGGFRRRSLRVLKLDDTNMSHMLRPGMELDPVQHVRFPWEAKSDHVHPWKEGTQGGLSTSMMTYMPALMVTPSGDLSAGWALAYDVSRDGKTYVLHLDPEAVFHDGTPLTAQRVKDSWEYAGSPAAIPSWGGAAAALNDIEGYQALMDGKADGASGMIVLDNHTLQVNFLKSDGLRPITTLAESRVTGLVKVEQANSDPGAFELSPIGIGPLRKTLDAEAGEWVASPAEHYWREPKATVSVEQQFVPDRLVQKIMYDTGEMDLWWPRPADALYHPSHPDHKFARKYPVAAGMWHLVFDTSKPPFDDIHVRRALAHGTDGATNWNLAFPFPNTRATEIIKEGFPCHKPREGRFDGDQVFDAEIAQQELSMSRYDPNNMPDVKISVSRPQMVYLAELMQDDWLINLGVNVAIERLEPGQMESADVNMYTRTSGGPTRDASFLLNFYGHSSSNWASELAHVNDSVLEQMLDQANAVPLGAPGRCQAYQAVEDRVLAGYYNMMGARGTGEGILLVQPWVRNYAASFDAGWVSVPHWKVARRDLSLYEVGADRLYE